MSTTERINFVCYKWGKKFNSDYVNILYSMVKRNTNLDFDFHCITDDSHNISSEIFIHKINDEFENNMFRKLETFSKDFLKLEGQLVVSLDLDLVIVGNIDFLAERPNLDFVAADSGKSGLKLHGAVYRVRVGKLAHVWQKFADDPSTALYANPERQDREQQWLEMQIENPHYFPKGKIISFKYDCNAQSWRMFGPIGAKLGITGSHFGVATLPEDAAIVSFHGNVQPSDVMQERFMEWKRAPFVADHWHL